MTAMIDDIARGGVRADDLITDQNVRWQGRMGA